MCNINILYKKNGVANTTSFIMAVTSHSYVYNHNGDGFYCSHDNKIVKSDKKIDYVKYHDSIEPSKVVISHQRLSTSGHEEKFHHPFSNDDFVLVHNGVMNQFLNGKGSDTFGFWKKFNKNFNRLDKNLSRNERIIKVISKLFEKDEGTYSIFIYDKVTKEGFYFKNTPYINFYENEDYLFITTEEDNKAFLPMITEKEFVELDIQKRIVYNIKEDCSVWAVYTFQHVEPKQIERLDSPRDYYEETFNTFDNGDIKEDKSKEKEEIELFNYGYNDKKEDKFFRDNYFGYY